MSKIAALAACALVFLCSGACPRQAQHKSAAPSTPVPAKAVAPAPKADVPAGAKALMEGYPDWVKGYRDGKLLLADGTEMVWDDGKKKEFTVRLDNSDPEDMFFVSYKVPEEGGKPAYLADAGRSRCEPLFKKMYGATQGAAQRHLVPVEWYGGKVMFTSVNGAADALRAAKKELDTHPELRKYLKSSGTFYWRKVRGAQRQSAHSYGIAIDLGVDRSDYWLWKNPKAGETARIAYANRMPRALVEIMQKHGFIWGGAWYHYDTMHFEYRPEILRYAELAGN